MQRTLIEVTHQVRESDEQPPITLNLREHFVDASDLPTLASLATILQEAVNLIEQQHGPIATPDSLPYNPRQGFRRQRELLCAP